MRRREFFTVLGGAAAWPLSARGQLAGLPVVGFLHTQSPDVAAENVRGFRQGLKETGFVEGESVTVEYRWAENHNERLAALASDLVHRRVAVIVATGGIPSSMAAKDATATIPILFMAADDPVKLGLVASLARPGANLTGVNFLGAEIEAKRLGLLHELLPTARRVAVLVNPANAETTDATLRDLETAARALDLRMRVFTAGSGGQINAAFQTFARDRDEAVLVGVGPPFNGRRVQLVQLATYYRIPTMYAGRQNVEVGGLISYGANLPEGYRHLGVYAGRILKGSKPGDLPVVQSTKFELVINAETARMLGLTIPPTLLARADEVIE
ncbi:MAG: ABC transporter substrate-binding protein [Xanthobacteraceae bacterium]